MSAPDRSPEAKARIVALIQRLHALSPDLRFGQIVAIHIWRGAPEGHAGIHYRAQRLFYVEDAELEELLEEYCVRHGVPPVETDQKGTDSTPPK